MHAFSHDCQWYSFDWQGFFSGFQENFYPKMDFFFFIFLTTLRLLYNMFYFLMCSLLLNVSPKLVCNKSCCCSDVAVTHYPQTEMRTDRSTRWICSIPAPPTVDGRRQHGCSFRLWQEWEIGQGQLWFFLRICFEMLYVLKISYNSWFMQFFYLSIFLTKLLNRGKTKYSFH